MNPNVAQTLDPKLKEAYDRVMGTAVNPQPAPQPKAEVQTPSSTPPASVEHAAEPLVSTPVTTIKPSDTFLGGQSDGQTVIKPASAKSDRKISPIIFVAVGIGFFALYTVIWLKVFAVV